MFISLLMHQKRNCYSMKYLIPIILLFALCSCDKDTSESNVASGKTLDDPDTSIKGNVARQGLYRLVRSGGVINDPSTSTGKSVLKPVVELVKTTDRIPLIKSGQIYLQYRIWPLPERAYADLRRVLKHPGMTLPDGTVSTGSDFMIKARVSSNQAIGYTGYGLDEDYELVEGDWVFQLWYGDEKIIEQTFTTYRPDKSEREALEPILALGNKAMGQDDSSSEQPFSRQNWPKVTVGGKTSSTTGGSQTVAKPSDKSP